MYPIQKNFLDSSTIYHAGKETTSVTPEDHQTAFSREEIAKVTQLQAHIRGWKARNEVFLPQQILPFVEEHFVEYKLKKRDYLNIARLICSELNQISINPQAFKGQSILVETKLNYTFLEPGEKPINVSRPFDLHIEIDDAGKNIEILAIPDPKRKGIVDGALGQGAFKLIYRAQNISVPRELISNKRAVKHTFSVLVVPMKGIEVIKKGYNIHKEILENVQGKFAELYVLLKPSSRYRTELYKQVWYNCTFQDAAKQGSVPLTFFPNSKLVKFTLKDKLKVFSDVAKSLQAMHEKGYVHRDIKANNLFIKLNPDQKPEGYIGDFDIAQKIGRSDLCGFMNEDQLGANGLIFPTTDIYGLALALRECLVPDFRGGWPLLQIPGE